MKDLEARDEIEQLKRMVEGLARQLAGVPVRLGDVVGISDHFQIVKGLAMGAVAPSAPAFQIDGIDPYEQHSAEPNSPLWVKAPAGGVTLADNTPIWAIWRENVLTFDPGSGSVQVDWLMFDNSPLDFPDFPLVQIKNTSGLARGFGSICAMGTPLNPPPNVLTRFPVFEWAEPNVDLAFVILLSDAALNVIVDAAIIGCVATQIDYTDASHKFANVINGNPNNMASAGEGPARIVHREKEAILGAGTLGIQWCQIQLGLALPVNESPRAVVYSVISKATGIREQDLTPGQGIVRRYLAPTGAIGTPWQLGATLLAETWMHTQSDVGKPCLLRESRKDNNGNPIYEMISEGCAAVPLSGTG